MKNLVRHGFVLLAGAAALPMSAPKLPAYEFIGRPQDPRLNMLRRFLGAIGSPVTLCAPAFLDAADAFSLDWRLLPSISFVESTAGKAAHNNNLFGWDSGRAKFPSPAEAISAVAGRLSNGARYRGKTLEQKLAVYNQVPGYARRVQAVMRRISPAE